MAMYCMMHTSKMFVFNTDESLVALAKAGEFEKLDVLVKNIKVEVLDKSDKRPAYGEVQCLFNLLIEEDEKVRRDDYASIFIQLALEANDYNLLNTLNSFGYYSEESKAFLERYEACRQEAVNVWKNSYNQNDPFTLYEERVGDIKVSFRGNSLYFEYEGVEYRALRFDN